MRTRALSLFVSALHSAATLSAAIYLALTAHADAQQPRGAQVRSWRCVAASAAGTSIFHTVVVPDCFAPPSTGWPAASRPSTRFARPIIPSGKATGLSAAVFGTTAVLTWAPPSSGGAPSSYILEAGSTSGASNLASFNTGSALTTLTLTNVSPGTHFMRVLSTSDSGTSAPSNEVIVKVAADACSTPPDAPAGLSARVIADTVTLVWQAAATGCAATSYVIQAGSSPGLSNLANFSTGSLATTFTATSVTAGTYYVRILAANVAGTSAASNEIAVVVSLCTSLPGIVSGLTQLVVGSTVTLSWDAASGAPTTYLINVGSYAFGQNLGVIDAGATTSFTAVGVGAGTYYVFVQAANACGKGPVYSSNTIAVIVGGPTQPASTLLHTFTGADGQSPFAALLLASDGNFYGTTGTTMSVGPGNVFRVTPAASFTVVHSFNGLDGAYSAAPLIQARDGNFYGTTTGGQGFGGEVFRMTPAGDVALLHKFAGTDGSGPEAPVLEANDGNLYGTTSFGGAAPGPGGTLFRLTPDGTFTVLHSLIDGADGSRPKAPLIQVNDGNLYGTAYEGGTSKRGTLFRLTSAGTFSVLHTFTGGADGGFPWGALIQAADGNLYGTTSVSGGSTFRGGTIFRMTLDGAFSVLHDFTGGDGEAPLAGLIQAADGNFYGTTSGGVVSLGTVFKMTPAGTVTTLHAFVGGAGDGAVPYAPLVAGRDALYGTTTRGGNANVGTVFKIGGSQ